MVFSSHLGFLEISKSDFSRSLYANLFREGYIGVSFFFILSGFVLAYKYQDIILKKQKSKKTFFIARVARIFPLHILTFIIAIPLTYNIFVHRKLHWFAQAVTNFTLTQSYIPKSSIYFSFNGPSWSISDEMFFYLLFPFLLFLIFKFRKRYFLFLAIISIVPLLTLVIPSSYYHHIFYISPFVRIFDFSIGVYLYNMYKIFSSKKSAINYDFMEISSILLLSLFFFFHQQIPQVARYSFYYWLPMSYLIFSFSFQGGMVSKLLSKKIFFHLGEISFGFYMFHQLVLRYFDWFNSKFHVFENDLLMIIITFSISLMISHYSFVKFENPMKNFVKNKLSDFSI